MPVIAWIAWLVFIATCIWAHTRVTQQPPVYDAATYALKARNFWANIHSPHPVNPLNIEPTFRPPGTVLMSYPFGFGPDYRPFYFRSVFFPILLIGCAVFVVGWRARLESPWQLTLLAIFLSTLPAFYYFEVSPDVPVPTSWGLVDNFLAGIAALALAAAIRSVADRSVVWASMAAVLSSFSMLIKPSGTLVAALVGLSWAGLSASRLLATWSRIDERRPALRLFAWSAFLMLAADVAVFAAARHSKYLSSENLAYGVAAIAIMKHDIDASWPVLFDAVHWGIGYVLPIWLLLTGALVAIRWRHIATAGRLDASGLPSAALAVCCAGILAFGIWFWLIGSGGAMQIRYAIPFVLMTCVASVPLVIGAFRSLPRSICALHAFLLAAPAVNVSLLLSHPHPSHEWQSWTGVSVSVAKSNPVMYQASAFITQMSVHRRSTTIYSMSANFTDAVFGAAAEYARSIQPKTAQPQTDAVSIIGPVDWQRPATYRFNDIVRADYMLFEPVIDAAARSRIAAQTMVSDFDSERRVMQAWATELTSADGVEVVSDSGTARILKIVDRIRLQQSFQRLYGHHHWRTEFVEGNANRLLTEEEFRTTLQEDLHGDIVLRDTAFDSMFMVRGLSASRAGTQLKVRLWWQPIQDRIEPDWVFFIHTIDEAGKIVYADHLPITRVNDPLGLRVIHADVGTFPVRSSGPLRVAVGFFSPNHASPEADKGQRDWGGRRVILSVGE